MAEHDKHIPHNLDLLRLAPEDEVNLALIYSLRNQYECIDLMQDTEQAIRNKMLARHQQYSTNYKASDYWLKAPEYTPIDLNSGNFKHTITQSRVEPFIIRGFFKDTEAVQQWNIEYFAKHYPNSVASYQIETAEGAMSDVLYGPLSEVCPLLLNNPDGKTYIHNSAQLFKDHPELIQQLPFDQLKQYFSPIAYSAILQLFMGGPNTGVRMHCANEFNAFMMVHGSKEWLFIPPEYTYALRPMLSANCLNAICDVDDHQQSHDWFEQHIPLYNRIPKYRFSIEPGDLLVFAPWWWHAVSNTTPTSIAVATRWTSIKPQVFPHGNQTFFNIQRSNPYFQAYSKQYVKRMLSGDVVGDEDSLRDTFGRYSLDD